jgi:outer membrane protein assembly factor BamA
LHKERLLALPLFFRHLFSEVYSFNRFSLFVSITLFFGLIIFWNSELYAQKAASLNPVYIDKLEFTGNDVLTTDELLAEISTKENTTYFGFFRPWLGVYNFAQFIFADTSKPAYHFKTPFSSDSSSIRFWLQNSLGETPRLYNPRDFDLDISRIRTLYHYYGYHKADVKSNISYNNARNKVSLEVLIDEGQPTRIDTIHYEGLDDLNAFSLDDFYEQKILETGMVCNLATILSERDRILSFFKNKGYYFFEADSVLITIDTLNQKAGVAFDINLPERIKYRKLNVVVHNAFGPDKKEQVKRTVHDGIQIDVYNNNRLSHNLIYNAIELSPGEYTQDIRRNATFQKLGNTGIFESISIQNDSLINNELYATIHLDLLPRHQIKPEILVDNRYNAPFIGTSLGYLNRNLFGGAESFNISTSIGAQLSYNKTLLEDINSDVGSALPYNFDLRTIYGLSDVVGDRFTTTLQYSFNQLPILLQQQSALLRFRSNFSANQFQRITVDFLELELVLTDTLKGFNELFTKKIASNLNVDETNSAAVETAIDSLLQKRLNPVIRFDFLYTEQSRIREGYDFRWNFLAEESGLLAYLIDRYIDKKTPAGFSDDDAQIFGLPYSHYLKLSSFLTYSKNLSPSKTLAYKLFLGYMFPYGKAENTPQERRFYSGGANSLRGWAFNSIGPGENPSETVSNLGADIKIETSLEYRIYFFTFLKQKSGLAFFTDIGNIWNREGENAFMFNTWFQQLAWDSGIGLRIGTPIGPIRLDFGYKLYDPSESMDKWVIKNWSPGKFNFSFAIGEAF